MIDSILTSTKNALGITESVTAFDDVITMHINSVFGTLNQLGIGPPSGFMIEDDTAVWADFQGTGEGAGPLLNSCRSYMYLVVKSLFDPSDARFTIAATTAQIHEYEWRLNIVREGVSWVDPSPPKFPTSCL